MGELAQILHDKKRVTASIADKARAQFSNLCHTASSDLRDRFNFGPDDRLDNFYARLLQSEEKYKELWHIVQLVLILSHGNADVEIGFSINGDMLVENLQEQSLVAQRSVYDCIKEAGDVLSVDINKTMLQYVRGSRSRYEEALEKKGWRTFWLQKLSMQRRE
jgi:hypothetical protein